MKKVFSIAVCVAMLATTASADRKQDANLLGFISQYQSVCLKTDFDEDLIGIRREVSDAGLLQEFNNGWSLGASEADFLKDCSSYEVHKNTVTISFLQSQL